jgi:hypothetical protein
MKLLFPALLLLALAACSGTDVHQVLPSPPSYQADDGNVYPCPDPANCPAQGAPAPDGQ